MPPVPWHVTLEEAQQRLPELEGTLDEQVLIVSHQGQEALVILSHAHYQAILETLDLQADPDLARDLHLSLHQAQGPERLSLTDVRLRFRRSAH